MKKDRFRAVLLLLCLLTFIFSVYKIVNIIETGKREEKNFEELRKSVVKLYSNDKEKVANTEMKEIYNKNNDFIAWLKVLNTPIDYPVMNTPSNPNFYLRKDFQKKYSLSGTLFVGEGAGIDGKFVIIYGHNMHNSTMFGSLDDYKDREFYLKHRDIVLSTVDEVRRYKVVGAFDANLNTDKFNYYNYYGDVSESDFETFMSLLSRYSIYPDYREISYSDQILMLSTCADSSGPARFVVVAKRIK